MKGELKEKAESAAKTYFGTDNIDVHCIPEHDAFLDAYEIGYVAALSDDGWTYCDERLPDDGESVNVTASARYGVERCPFVISLAWEDEQWVYEDYDHPSFWKPIPENWTVIAWRRKPDPAKGRGV